MTPRELVLHVLVRRNEGRKPEPLVVEALKTAFPSLAYLPTDELCNEIVYAFCGDFPDTELPRTMRAPIKFED